MLEQFLGEVELKDVAFRYPARPLVPVFEKFSVHVPPGTALALVGQSGSGKCVRPAACVVLREHALAG